MTWPGEPSGRSIAQGLVDMPFVVPHIVADLALLMVPAPGGPIDAVTQTVGQREGVAQQTLS